MSRKGKQCWFWVLAVLTIGVVVSVSARNLHNAGFIAPSSPTVLNIVDNNLDSPVVHPATFARTQNKPLFAIPDNASTEGELNCYWKDTDNMLRFGNSTNLAAKNHATASFPIPVDWVAGTNLSVVLTLCLNATSATSDVTVKYDYKSRPNNGTVNALGWDVQSQTVTVNSVDDKWKSAKLEIDASQVSAGEIAVVRFTTAAAAQYEVIVGCVNLDYTADLGYDGERVLINPVWSPQYQYSWRASPNYCYWNASDAGEEVAEWGDGTSLGSKSYIRLNFEVPDDWKGNSNMSVIATLFLEGSTTTTISTQYDYTSKPNDGSVDGYYGLDGTNNQTSPLTLGQKWDYLNMTIPGSVLSTGEVVWFRFRCAPSEAKFIGVIDVHIAYDRNLSLTEVNGSIPVPAVPWTVYKSAVGDAFWGYDYYQIMWVDTGSSISQFKHVVSYFPVPSDWKEGTDLNVTITLRQSGLASNTLPTRFDYKVRGTSGTEEGKGWDAVDLDPGSITIAQQWYMRNLTIPASAVSAGEVVEVRYKTCSPSTVYMSLINTQLHYIRQVFQQPGTPNLHPISPAIDHDGIISLDWDDVAGANTYNVYRDTSPVTSPIGLTPINTTTSSECVDKVTTNGTYYYAVLAINGSGTSELSASQAVQVAIPPESSGEEQGENQTSNAQNGVSFNISKGLHNVKVVDAGGNVLIEFDIQVISELTMKVTVFEENPTGVEFDHGVRYYNISVENAGTFESPVATKFYYNDTGLSASHEENLEVYRLLNGNTWQNIGGEVYPQQDYMFKSLSQFSTFAVGWRDSEGIPGFDIPGYHLEVLMVGLVLGVVVLFARSRRRK
ncbi:MAG: hypothetical protein ACTSU5_14710 [Promethearchaeota archaeon]